MAADGCDEERFAALERRADRGLFRDYRDGGEALRQLRDEERACWEPEYGGWGQYIEKRWGISRQHANYLIQASEVAAELSSCDDAPPLPARHAALLYRFKDTDIRRRLANEIAPLNFRKASAHVISVFASLTNGPTRTRPPRRKPLKASRRPLSDLDVALNACLNLELGPTAAAIRQLDEHRRERVRRDIRKASRYLAELDRSVKNGIS
ncbi:MAG: hypothetical protein ACXVRK_04015 [Gaiellaceae bacterium]